MTVVQDASSIILPDVGKQCDAAVGAPGTAVDPSSLRDALVTLLETWVDRVGPNPAPLRPNVVVILTDDQRFDTIGLEHSIDGVTPVMPNVLNELANQGVSFQHSFVTTALCAPSRASLLAAKYSHTTGVHDNSGTDGGFSAFDDTSTVAVWLQAAGYRTGLYGKYINGYGTSAPYTPPGWDEWHAFKNVAYFNYTLDENGVEVAFGERRHRLLDRRPARPGGAVHPRLGRRHALLPLLRSEGAAWTGDPRAPPRRLVQRHPAVAAAELQRGRRLRQAGVAASDRAVGRHA